METLTKLKALFGNIAAQDSELGRKIREAQQKIEALQSAQISRDSYITHGSESIDARGAAYLKRLQDQVNADSKRDPLDLSRPDLFHRIFAPNHPSGHQEVTPDALCWFFGPEIKKRFSDAVNALDWPAADKTCGPALSDRVKQIEIIGNELNDLQRQRNELREAAADAGLSLGRLEEDPATLSKAELSRRQEAARALGV
jgi:hypothetical protein